MSATRFTARMHRRRRSRQRISIAIRVGTIVRDQRERGGLTKTELGHRAGLSRQMVGAVESGQSNPTLDVIVQLLDGLGIELDLVVRGPVALGDARQHDAAHAICSGYVQRRLESAGWRTAREVRIEDGRYIGWIDLMAFHEPTGTLLVIEIKTRINDLGAIERSLDWHERGAAQAAARLGWRASRTVSWLLALGTDEVDQQIRRSRTAVEATFPSRAAEMSSMLVDPLQTSSSRRGLALVDPRSRRRAWLLRTRVDGRRSDTPYCGYADFMDRIRRDRSGH